MAHAQKPDSVFQQNGRVHLYRRGCQFSRVLAFLECGSAENDCSNTGWTVPSQTEACLATHSIRLFRLHFSSRASPCATRFRFHSTMDVLAELTSTFSGYAMSLTISIPATCGQVFLQDHVPTEKMGAYHSLEGPVATAYHNIQHRNFFLRNKARMQSSLHHVRVQYTL